MFSIPLEIIIIKFQWQAFASTTYVADSRVCDCDILMKYQTKMFPSHSATNLRKLISLSDEKRKPVRIKVHQPSRDI